MKAIEIIMVPVKDQQQAKTFYKKLGFEVIIESPYGNGENWLQMGLPGQKTTISLASFSSLIFETADIEKEIQELGAKGIEVGPIDNTPWGRFAWLKDLDGNSICLHQ